MVPTEQYLSGTAVWGPPERRGWNFTKGLDGDVIWITELDLQMGVSWIQPTSMVGVSNARAKNPCALVFAR